MSPGKELEPFGTVQIRARDGRLCYESAARAQTVTLFRKYMIQKSLQRAL